MSKSKKLQIQIYGSKFTTELKGHFHILVNLPITIILVVCNLWVGTFPFIIRACRFDPGDKLDLQNWMSFEGFPPSKLNKYTIQQLQTLWPAHSPHYEIIMLHYVTELFSRQVEPHWRHTVPAGHCQYSYSRHQNWMHWWTLGSRCCLIMADFAVDRDDDKMIAKTHNINHLSENTSYSKAK